MKVYQFKPSVFVLLASTWLVINSCKDDEVIVPPTVATENVTQLSHTNAVSRGYVVKDGGSAVTVRGVVWNTSPGPTGANSYTQDGSGTGAFVSNLTGLTENTKYYVRAYAINGAGVGYGPEISFTTIEALPPTLAALTITNVGDKSATAACSATADNGSAISAKGVCWSTTPSPTLGNNKTTDGAGTGSFSSSISGLQPNTVYYVRAYATNGKGTSYSNEVSFETLN